MRETTAQSSWYAVFVLTGEEDKVKARLAYRFYEKLRFLVPRRILNERKDGVWQKKERLLFPGYVLVNGEISPEDYYKMKAVPGMVKLLRDGYDPIRIAPEEIEIIGRLTRDSDLIGISSLLMVNGSVTVVDGPLKAMEGCIVSINNRKGRAKIRLNFMGEERCVDVGISVLQPVY